MTFSEILSQYLSLYHITISELSAETGISKSMLSRMKNGKKEPDADSELLDRLSKGISLSARACGDTQADCNVIKETLAKTLHTTESFDIEQIVSNLNCLIASLDFRVSDLSRHLNFDASYLSLIRSGKRNPSDIASFCIGVAEFISLRYDTELPLLSSLLGCRQNELINRNSRQNIIYKWLTKHAPQEDQTTLHFLNRLDTFNLNEFLGAMQFAESSFPLNISGLPMQKNYYTQSGFMQAELDWLNAVIASASTEPVLFYSDMPIEEMSKSSDFSKQWMLGLALLLKKGIHLNMIHQIDRQDSEMMLGLEAWIPLYMTGQVSPYYLADNKCRYFHHFLRTSDVACLSGEAVTGFHNDGRYCLSRRDEDVAYCKKRGDELLSKAQPLMEIYRKSNASDYISFLNLQYKKPESFHRNILSSPPIYTVSPQLLKKILEKNHASQEDTLKIMSYAEKYRQWMENTLTSSVISDELFQISENDFKKYPVSLPLSDLFLDREYTYDYDDYLAHLQQTKEFAKQNTGYTVSFNRSAGFRNINIRIAQGKFVMISKEKSPTIHFVIHHPKLRNVLEHLTISIVENDLDLICYEKYMAEYQANPVTYSLDEVKKELGI